ncbi:hypothetical protein AAFF_G00039660 [Aldrovandia affinis]|uniref:Integrase p58-like C-terminal domain-containing protein n=1 Tax=Aldrovandia affinis TaxID=143900 RepID=A0AAD7S337_9TELE|nr:hypothetical protein AAFF_G00039660 [Aldrovandia affinis]
MHYATRYPKAVPLRTATSKAISQELAQLEAWEEQLSLHYSLIEHVEAMQTQIDEGLYTVWERVGPVNYLIDQSGRQRPQQLCHVNLLKKWVEGPPR